MKSATRFTTVASCCCWPWPESAEMARPSNTRAKETSDNPTRRNRRIRKWDMDLALVRRRISEFEIGAISPQHGSSVHEFGAGWLDLRIKLNRNDSLPNP